MPNPGFNPFVPRVNVYTTGVEMGDSRRFNSRDVIRLGREHVDIDATLTPGEPGRNRETQFEMNVADMIRKERDPGKYRNKKLKFIDGEEIQSSLNGLSGLKSQKDYIHYKEMETRRRELSRYQLNHSEIDQILEYESQKSQKAEDVKMSDCLQSIYTKLRRSEKESKLRDDLSENQNQGEALANLVDRDIDDFLMLRRTNNPLARYSKNEELQKANAGVIQTHIPRIDMHAMLNQIENEFLQQHPILLEDDISEIAHDKTTKRHHDDIAGNDIDDGTINTKIMKQTCNAIRCNNSESNRRHSKVDIVVTDEFIKNNRKSEEEMLILPQMRNYVIGETNNSIFVKNLPKDISMEEIVVLFNRFESPDLSLPRIVYTLLSGRLRGQAFISFATNEIAFDAIQRLHGFIFRNKIIILQFKKK